MTEWMRRTWFPWVLVGLAAVGVQAVLIRETLDCAAFAYPLIDSASYHQWALAILKGKGPSTPFWQPPLFPWLLALVYGIFGDSMIAARAVQGALGVAASLLTLALGTRLGGKGVGLAAGLMTVLCGPLLFFQTQLLPTGLAVVLDLALVILILRAMERPEVKRWGMAGLGLGAAALALPNVLVMGLPALVFIRKTGDPAPRRRLARLAAFLAGAALVVVPVTVRNRVVGGQWVLISSNGGINFYIGNNPHMDVTVATRPGLDWERLTQVPFMHGAANSREADRYFWRESVQFMRRQPGQATLQLLRKARQFVAAREIPRNLDLYVMRKYSRVLAILTFKRDWFAFPFGVIGPLALLGLALFWNNGPAHRLTISFVLLYAMSVILFFPTARYRAPLYPFFILYALMGALWLVRRMRVPGPAWWAGVGGLALAALAVNAPVKAPTDGIRFDAELESAIGAAFQVRGYQEPALRRYRKARELDPELVDASYNMGVVLSELKRRRESMEAYRDVLRIRPDHDKARINLATALYQAGSLGEAADMLELATVLNPKNPKTWHNRAMVLEAMGRHQEALSYWKEAAELDPAYRPILEQMRQKGLSPIR